MKEIEHKREVNKSILWKIIFKKKKKKKFPNNFVKNVIKNIKIKKVERLWQEKLELFR